MKAVRLFGALMVRALQAKGASCLSCGQKIVLPRETGLTVEDVVQCPACGCLASLAELAATGMVEDDATEAGEAGQPPEGTRIVQRDLKGGGTAWEIPPSGRSGGLLFFGGLWLAVVVLITGGFVASSLKDGFSMAFVIIAVFWAVGIGFLYAGLRVKYSRHLVIVDPQSVILGRSLFGRRKLKTFPRDAVTSVEKKVLYERNYEPVYGIEIRARRGKLRFGTALEEAEKNWLVAELRNALRLDGSRLETAGGDPPAAFRRLDAFSVTIPRGKSSASLVGGAVFAAVALGFVAIGIFAMRDAGLFRYVWIGGSSLFALIGIATTVGTVRGRGVTREVSADSRMVRVRKLRNGMPLEERSIERKEVVAVRAFKTGTHNNQVAWRLEVVGKRRALPVCSFHTAEELPAVAREIAGKLGVGGEGSAAEAAAP